MCIKKRIYLLLSVTVLSIVVAVAAANTNSLKKWLNRQPVSEDTDAGNSKPDPVQVALMNELMAWLKPFDSSNTSYYLNGLLTAVDKTDSANAMINVPYTVCRNGQRFYLRISQTETMNTDEQYLFVDHPAKRMLIGKSQNLVQSPAMPLNELYDFIASEGFVFSKTTAGSRSTTITVLNPNHISYKEFTVQYDSAARQVKKIFIRQAEVTDPMNADKEKWITLVLNEWNDEPEPGKYMELKKFIHKKQDEWEPAQGFSNYELINQ